MNKITLLLIVCLIAFAGCRSTKKATKTSVNTDTEVSVNQEAKSNVSVKTDNNILTETETVIAETTYFKPDSTGNISQTVNTTIDGKGAVKSTKTTTIKVKQVDKGKTETEKINQAKTDTNTKDNTVTKSDVTEKAKVPIPFGWIFGIMVILLVAYFLFKNSPVGKAVKTFTTKLFKK